jgi:hypothetical protein
MNYEQMTKEELIKEVKKLENRLNRKKAERLPWKKIMNDTLAKGPDYWSNGHFLLKNSIEIPKAVLALKGLCERTPETTVSELMGNNDRKTSDREAWSELENDENSDVKTMTEYNVSFNKLYITMLDKLVPGFTLEVKDDRTPAIIQKDGELIGVLMPLRN